MTGFTIVDGVVLVVVVLSAVLAYSRGFLREVLSIVAWVAAAVCGFVFAPAVEPLVREIPILRDIIGTTCELSMLAAFAAVFAVALVIVSLFTPLLSGLVQNSTLGPVDQGLGFLFGVARGLLIVIIALVVYDTVMGVDGGVPQVDNSRTREILANAQESVASMLPEEGPQWVASKFTALTDSCNAPGA
ncbi:CvpA family protein [Amaricoccus macauensis]|uniref:CvpA family protein n=1 Tax=Amaricoccus macauensis TaxID=57001 RepID=UPI003C79AAC7